MTDDLVERVAQALATESGVTDWKHVSEEGDYDSRNYWRRLARAAIVAFDHSAAKDMKNSVCPSCNGYGYFITAPATCDPGGAHIPCGRCQPQVRWGPYCAV